MSKKTVADLKNKLIGAIDEVDTSKLTLCDLKMLADIVSVVSNINETQVDFVEALSKISTMGFGSRQATLSDLKEEK